MQRLEGNEKKALSDLQINRDHQYPDSLPTSTRNLKCSRKFGGSLCSRGRDIHEGVSNYKEVSNPDCTLYPVPLLPKALDYDDAGKRYDLHKVIPGGR